MTRHRGNLRVELKEGEYQFYFGIPLFWLDISRKI